MERKTVSVDVEWKAGASPGEVEGYASVFGNVDREGDVVMPGAFRKTIADWSRASQPLPLIADHDLSTNGVIGSVHRLREDRHGLKFGARLSPTAKAQDIRTNLLEGHIRGTSYTYEVMRSTPANGKGGARRYLDELRLYEITVSPFPVNELAGITSVKASTAAWDGSPSRFTDEQYRRSCLIDRGGDAPVKQRCSLPVREPGGAINVNAVHAAAAALAGGRGGVNASPELKRSAARKLIRIYSEIGEDPPESLRRVAGAGSASFVDWLESMQHATAIKDPFARKAAIDELIRGYENEPETLVAASEDASGTTESDAATTPEAGGTSSADTAYAVSILHGPPDGAPTGEPSETLPGPIAELELRRFNEQIAAIEAEVNEALGKDPT